MHLNNYVVVIIIIHHGFVTVSSSSLWYLHLKAFRRSSPILEECLVSHDMGRDSLRLAFFFWGSVIGPLDVLRNGFVTHFFFRIDIVELLHPCMWSCFTLICGVASPLYVELLCSSCLNVLVHAVLHSVVQS